jgi:hypothetical protein
LLLEQDELAAACNSFMGLLAALLSSPLVHKHMRCIKPTYDTYLNKVQKSMKSEYEYNYCVSREYPFFLFLFKTFWGLDSMVQKIMKSECQYNYCFSREYPFSK